MKKGQIYFTFVTILKIHYLKRQLERYRDLKRINYI